MDLREHLKHINLKFNLVGCEIAKIYQFWIILRHKFIILWKYYMRKYQKYYIILEKIQNTILPNHWHGKKEWIIHQKNYVFALYNTEKREIMSTAKFYAIFGYVWWVWKSSTDFDDRFWVKVDRCLVQLTGVLPKVPEVRVK